MYRVSEDGKTPSEEEDFFDLNGSDASLLFLSFMSLDISLHSLSRSPLSAMVSLMLPLSELVQTKQGKKMCSHKALLCVSWRDGKGGEERILI